MGVEDVAIEKGSRTETGDQDRIDNIVPISTGCKGSCTYCITRYARGKLDSYSPACVKSMIRSGLREGRSEVLLTSQDSASYGYSLDEEGELDLGDLIRSITGDIEGEMRIRVGMMNPDTGLSILYTSSRSSCYIQVYYFSDAQFHLLVSSLLMD